MGRQKINAFVTGSLLAGGLACGAGNVLAYEPGDFILRAGVASVQPDESSSALNINGGTVAGTGVGVDGDEQLGLTGTYMLTSHLGIGLLAATPFEHDIKANGLGLDAGDSKQLPPTLTLQYFPMEPSSAFQPYVGIGVNYTAFFDEGVDSDLEAFLGESGDLELDDSIGLAVQVGFDYAIDEHWLLNASVWYIDIDTEADFKFDTVRIKADVDIDPWVYMVGVGYKF
ncbi:outer membrane protein OmpW [Gammaproteobacteria bacterium 53_120_T64]|nr:outer membrane protein OmpW [Gammaproteobacteria bacterium 53_120_T64]